MPVRKEELTRAMEIINEAVGEIKTQDNRMTSDPIFMVQELTNKFYSKGFETWQNIQPFFTNKAAERYIRENKHNLTRPRIFVASGYRNREWIAVRTVLKNIADIAGEESWSKMKS